MSQLFAEADRALVEADLADDPARRYLAAQVAAQQVALVILATRPGRRRCGPRPPWAVLAVVAPEYSEWAGFFALTHELAASLGAGGAVSQRQADDLLRDALVFREQVALRFRSRTRQAGLG